MKKHFLLSMLIPMALMASAQGTATQPEAVTDGAVTLPVNGMNAVTAYYSYTSTDDDRLVTFTLPSPVATVVASATPGNKIDSDIPNMQLPDFTSETTIVKCLAPKDEPVYLKVSFPALSFAPDAVETVINVSSEVYEINYGLSCSEPIAVDDKAVFLPLTMMVEPPFIPTPVYASYTAEKDGWLYLRFQPSVTMIEYASDCNGEFKRIKHEYVMQNNKTVGAKAMMEVKAGESFIFRVTGFNAAMMTASVENPEPGTSCDFPIDITAGEITLPAEAGNYYWRLTPENEGCIEITSDAGLTGGMVEVMMDCNGTGSFAVYNYLHLRTWVWDRMEYLIHINKATATAEAENVNVALVAPQSYDDIGLAETLVAGETYSTPNFAGEYYYRVVAPGEGYTFKLTTLNNPEDEFTRVNLYNPDEMSVSVAKGFDMSYELSAGVEYLLKWTVFDVDNAMKFKIALDNTGAAIESTEVEAVEIETVKGAVVVTGYGVLATVTDTAGRLVGQTVVNGNATINAEPGVYVVKAGETTTKVMVK